MSNINDKQKSYDPIKPLVNSYLAIENENNEKIVTSETIPGFIDPSSVEARAEHQAIRSMYDNTGKYFDRVLFNKKFDEYINEQKSLNTKKEKVRLDDLNKIEKLKIKPYQLPFNKILINTKNTCFDLYDDIMNGSVPVDKLKGDNLFYLAILFITVTLIYIFMAFIFE
jgi:hypothetical protein